MMPAYAQAQIGIHKKPIGVLNVNHFYDPLFSMVDKGMEVCRHYARGYEKKSDLEPAV